MQPVWKQIIDILEKSVNPGLFHLWIRPLDAECSEKSLAVYAPNEFVAAWVRDHLQQQIIEAATKAMGHRPALTVMARPSLASTPVQVPAPAKVLGPDAGRRTGAVPAAQASSQARASELGLPGLARGPRTHKVRWRFDFDDFVVGPGNEMAFAASRDMCRGTHAMEQLFISASPGLGKTHLLHAMGRGMAECSNRDQVRVAYLTAEEFTTRLVLAIKAHEAERFKAMYREHVDVLLLEDIHFLQGKQKIQDELVATLKALQANGSRVVLSSTFLPRELKEVDSHLASMLGSGFLANIENPDFETRKRILDVKATKHHVALPDQVSDILAHNLKNDVRQLESCLHSLIIKARLMNRTIDSELARDILSNYTQPDEDDIGLKEIVEFICQSFELSATQLASKSRKRNIVLARNTAFFLARKHTDLGLKQIGSQFNRRHSTVLKGITNVEREMSLETPLGRQIKQTIARLR